MAHFDDLNELCGKGVFEQIFSSSFVPSSNICASLRVYRYTPEEFEQIISAAREGYEMEINKRESMEVAG